MNRSFEHRGVLLDITRGRVPKLSYLKKVIALLADNGINQVQLYIEHTFKYKFWEGTDLAENQYDGYDAVEVRELDDYCHGLGVELIPCIATFGHIFEILQSDAFGHLCELPRKETPVYSWMDRQLHHTIDCSSDESLKFIEQMIGEITSCYRSPYLNICGDETYDIGQGRSKTYVDLVGPSEAYIEFLNKILKCVYDKGKRPMYWGDVILKHPDQIHKIDEGAMPMHWWYESEVDEEDFFVLESLGRDYYTCPATVGWNHFMNHYERSMTNIDKMIHYGGQHGAIGGLITDWGDFGHVNHLSTSIPMLVYGAKRMQNLGGDMTGWHEDLIDSDYLNLLTEIGNERLITFEHLMRWYYDHFNGNQAYGNIKKELIAMPYTDIISSLNNIGNLRIQLGELVSVGPCELLPTRDEISVALDGMTWMLRLVLYLKDQVYQCPSELTWNHSDIDDQIRRWYHNFSVIWLRDNRESELYRVGQVVDHIRAYLQNK